MRESSISDQKRAVRKLHWEHARTVLRVRDKVHHRAWRLLTIAGPAPHEEIGCIRELMHQAHITSVDIDPANLEAAIEAGADEVIQGDIGETVEYVKEHKWPTGYVNRQTIYDPPTFLAGQSFDVICLDLTGPANDWLKRAVQVYFRSTSGVLSHGGVLIVTFSYGRDVVEVYEHEWERAAAIRKFDPVEHLADMPAVVAMRVWYLFRSLTSQISSCLQYKGGEMPMVSCLLRKGPKPPRLHFEQLAHLDYELLVAEDPGKLYACPADRLQDIRARFARRSAAQKAVETRRLREGKQPQLRLVANDGGDLTVAPPSRIKQMEKLWSDCTSEERAAVWRSFHQLYREQKNLRVDDPDVRARAELMEEIRQDRERQLPGA